MTVAELIEVLKQKPGHIQVAYEIYSTAQLLQESQIRIVTLCEARPDGWVEDLRPDKPSVDYLVLPGN